MPHHGYLWAEVAPLAPVAIEALTALLPLCVLVVAFGIVYAARHVVLSLGGFVATLVNRVPFVGSSATSLINKLIKALVGPLANAETYLDNHIGTCWHKLARVVDKIRYDLVRLAQLTLLISQAITTGLNPSQWREVIRLIVAEIKHEIHSVGHILHSTVIHTKVVYHIVTHDVVTRLGRVSHSVAVDLPRELDRLRTKERQIAHEVDVTIPRDLAKLRREAQAAEDHAIGLFRWLKAHPYAAASTAFAGAVAIALQRLGLEWVKCNAARSFFKKRGCGAWNLIDDLLGFAADFLILTNICQVIPLLEEAFSTVAAPLIGALSAAGAGMCAGTAGPPEHLPSPGLELPPNPSLTLNLP